MNSKNRSFLRLPPMLETEEDEKQSLLSKLKEIYEAGWVHSKSSPFSAFQSLTMHQMVGYTLEALLGVMPNGFAAPDYLGWEVKQYSVNNFEKNTAKTPVTVFTPEPTEGVYTASGVVNYPTLWLP